MRIDVMVIWARPAIQVSRSTTRGSTWPVTRSFTCDWRVNRTFGFVVIAKTPDWVESGRPPAFRI